MKKLEKKVYNEIILQAYNSFPEEGNVNLDDPKKDAFYEWLGRSKSIYMYTARTADNTRVGVVGNRPMLKSVPNCSFSFGSVDQFFEFIKRNNISVRFPYIKKEEVVNEQV
jgi:hypothetical protein